MSDNVACWVCDTILVKDRTDCLGCPACTWTCPECGTTYLEAVVQLRRGHVTRIPA